MFAGLVLVISVLRISYANWLMFLCNLCLCVNEILYLTSHFICPLIQYLSFGLVADQGWLRWGEGPGCVCVVIYGRGADLRPQGHRPQVISHNHYTLQLIVGERIKAPSYWDKRCLSFSGFLSILVWRTDYLRLTKPLRLREMVVTSLSVVALFVAFFSLWVSA